jgi:hypothetical protein
MAPTCEGLCGEEDGDEDEEAMADNVLVVDALIGSGSLT